LDRYWNEPCDNIFKANSALFEYLFKNYGGQKGVGGKKLRMDWSEFDEMIEDSGALINDLMNQREIPMLFNKSLMLRANELDSNKHC
jgi:hypothetical protein